MEGVVICGDVIGGGRMVSRVCVSNVWIRRGR